MYTLAETTQGVCPVCGYDWWNDPNLLCRCTAPHPNDEQETAKAYLRSARQRGIKLRYDQRVLLEKGERALLETKRLLAEQSGPDAIVVPIRQAHGHRQRRKRITLVKR